MPRRRSKTSLSIALLLCVWGATGCVTKRPATLAATDTAARDSLASSVNQVKKLDSELANKNTLILQLTAELEEKTENNRLLQKELERTRDVLDYAEKQFISLEKDLQQHETKASAVASLAEAKLAYNKRVRVDASSLQLANVHQAKDKVEKADQLLTKTRYAASVYFAKRAVRLLEEPSRDRRVIRIVSVNHANMRSGPGLTYNIVEKLSLGTVLVQVDNDSEWHKVETKEGKYGWIHASVTISR